MSQCSACGDNPCGCVDEEPVGHFGFGDGPNGSYCDLDIENNVWVEGVVDLSANPPKRGICMLDSMTPAQVIYTLQRTPQARCDLPKVTSNPDLLTLLARVQLLPTGNAEDQAQSRLNANHETLPFYNVFRGNPPYKPGNSK